MTTRMLAVFAALILATMPVQAHRHQQVTFDQHGISQYQFNPGPLQKAKPRYRKHLAAGVLGRSRSRLLVSARHHEKPPGRAASISPQIVAHPAGCPRVAFCGCGASIEVFGKSIRDLWLAKNWFKFPRTSPARGMVAVRRHHVFVIREVRGRGIVLAYDANSGGHRTRIHLRSLAGYVVVNPHGRVAMN